MKTLNRLLNMVLRGKQDQFNTVLQEELKERAVILMEDLYKIQCNKALEYQKVIQEAANTTENTIKKEEIQYITKLYESLNIDNRKRMLKLLSESKDGFDKVLKIAKLKHKG